MLKIIDNLNPKNVILIHGDEDALDWMGSSILKKHNDLKVYIANTGKEIEIL